MSAPAASPDAVAAALVAVLTPGGTPVGTLGAVLDRTPSTPYEGPLSTPLVLIRPVQTVHDWLTAGSKQDRGLIELLYRDRPLSQYQADDPSTTQAQIETTLWANRTAIVTALDAHRSLDGAIVALGAYEETYNPDGVEVTWDTSMWIGLTLIIRYQGAKQNMPPTTG